MQIFLLLTTLFLCIIGNVVGAQGTKHSFLACGQNTYIMGADGKPSWTHPAATRDGYVLDDGTVILTLSKSKRFRGGAVVSVAPDGMETLIWKGTQSEVNSAHGNRVVDFDANGKIVWTLTSNDLPGNWLQDPCGGQVFSNGNVVITSYAAGRTDRHSPKLFEVTPDKKVVWKYSDGQTVGIHHFQIITTNGKKLSGPVLK